MVKLGQIYKDKDKRESNRLLLVMEVGTVSATLRPCNEEGELNRYGKPSHIKLVNLEKRFTLFKDAPTDLIVTE